MATVYDKSTPFCGECECYWGTVDGEVVCLFPASDEEYEKFCPKWKHMVERCNGCAYLEADDNGEWVCCGGYCIDVPDDDCPVMREEGDFLVCKVCGYKQYDEQTVRYFKEKYPEMEAHDIPYTCGACMNEEEENANG